MPTLRETLLASTVIAAVVSGVISIVISRLNYKDSLRLSQYDKRRSLSIEVYKNLQNALAQIDQTDNVPHSTDVEEDIAAAFTTMFGRSKEKMELAKTILGQIEYLIPQEKANYLITRHSKLEETYVVLLASAYNLKGLPETQITAKTVSAEELPNRMSAYIDETEKLLKEIKAEIINALRDLLDT